MQQFTAIYHTKGRRVSFPMANFKLAMDEAKRYGKANGLSFYKLVQR